MTPTRAQKANDHRAVALATACSVFNEAKFIYTGEIFFTDETDAGRISYSLAYIPNAQGLILQMRTGDDDEGNPIFIGVTMPNWGTRQWELVLSRMQELFDATKAAQSPEDVPGVAEALASCEDFIRRAGRNLQ